MNIIRYALQSAARQLLLNERVARCLQVRVGPQVLIWRSMRFESAHYSQLFTCASIWACPVCSAKISERRRALWDEAIAGWDRGSILFATFTTNHKRHESLEQVLSGITLALSKLRRSYGWKQFKQAYDVAGLVRSLEVTYSTRNGWHPHFHALIFLNRFLGEVNSARSAIRTLWQSSLKKAGRWCDWRIGANLNFVYGKAPHEYLLKHAGLGIQGNSDWTAGAELTKHLTKKGRKKQSRTPTQLLLDYWYKQDLNAGKLWQDYAFTLKGRRHLRMSDGLSKVLNLAELEASDKELAEKHEELAYLFARLSPAQWRLIVQADIRGEVLAKAAEGDYVEFARFLQEFGIINIDFADTITTESEAG